jgi:hypothetical protein
MKTWWNMIQNNHKIPHFSYNFTNPSHMHYGCIVADGEVIHKVENLNAFYQEFGFTPAMRKAGVLPDEFIWAEYISNTDVHDAACLQIRIIEYLIKNSSQFIKKYGLLYESWIAEHVKEAVARGVTCTACKMESFCEN